MGTLNIEQIITIFLNKNLFASSKNIKNKISKQNVKKRIQFDKKRAYCPVEKWRIFFGQMRPNIICITPIEELNISVGSKIQHSSHNLRLKQSKYRGGSIMV